MEEKRHTCRFNKMVDCESRMCWQCGWNPNVASIRIKDWLRRRNVVSYFQY